MTALSNQFDQVDELHRMIDELGQTFATLSGAVLRGWMRIAFAIKRSMRASAAPSPRRQRTAFHC
jgi:hypothetical protein